mgnify:CR=1 FL=1|tara:strand:+ start:386 stop:808 length:423 start_codon:yes stop_codon:yes gene_type:complete
MSIVLLKLFHYLAIIFSGGVLVGGGIIQAVYTRANQTPDTYAAKALKILGYLGLASLVTLWVSGIILSNLIYGGFVINSAFTIKIIAAAFLLILSFIVNIHVYNSSKKNQPPNKYIMKVATMLGRGLIILVLLGAAIAFN